MGYTELARAGTIGLALLSFPGCARPDANVAPLNAAAPAWVNSIGGKYAGLLAGGDQLEPVITELTQTNSGSVVGTYVFLEPGNIGVEGKLDHCSEIRELELECQWHDKYGSGALEMAFASDFEAFAGQWSSGTTPDRWSLWTGRLVAGRVVV